MTARPPLWGRLLEYWSEDEARKWLAAPQPLLGGAVPAEMLAREDDSATELHRLIDQIDAGAYI